MGKEYEKEKRMDMCTCLIHFAEKKMGKKKKTLELNF